MRNKYHLDSLYMTLLIIFSLLIAAGCQTGHHTNPSVSGPSDNPPISTERDVVKRHYVYDYFDTQAIFLGARMTQNIFDDLCSSLEAELAYYHRLFNSHEQFPGVVNVASLNAHAGRGSLKIDSELFELLRFCRDMHTHTEGLVNIALGSVLDRWHQARSKALDNPASAALPEQKQLAEAAKHSKIEDLILNEQELTAELRDPQMLLDTGAIAKGFALQKIAEKAAQQGVRNFAIDLGGDIRTVGTRDDDLGPWRIAIQNPQKDPDKPFIDVLEIAGGCVFTSGIYERTFRVDGKDYHHIINPVTLFPAEGYQSITVVTANAAEADVLSTALFNSDAQQTKNLLEHFQPEQVIWVDQNNQVTYWR